MNLKNMNAGKENWNYPNPRTTNPDQRRMQRVFEIIPGLLTWITLIGLFVFSWLIPAWMAIFIIVYDVYWIHRTIYIAIYSIMAYKKKKYLSRR